MHDLVGWIATIVFTASYFFRTSTLRLLQILGAALWMTYGVMLGEPPIIVANALVLLAGIWTFWRQGRRGVSAAP